MKNSTYTFDSFYTVGVSLPSFTEEETKNEPMLFGANYIFAYENGGPITRAFLDRLFIEPEDDPLSLVFDSKVTMLMPKFYPCIPGWHHDDVPRSSPDGQPNYDTPEYRPKHCMALVNGDICPTEFAVGRARMNGVPDGKVIYRQWHYEVERHFDTGHLTLTKIPSGTLVYFDDRTFHQGTRATGNGWRWFGRASWNTKRPVVNQIRRQVQIYLENPMQGW